MNPVSLVITGAAALATIVAAQPITVVGTGDPKVDVAAVQSAVDQGGHVVLKGHFSFDAPATVAEQPSLFYSGAALGMVGVTKAVSISGALDDQGEMTIIEGGANPFYVEAPGAHITIRGLRFVRSKAAPIRVVAARGLTIVSNRIEGIIRDTNITNGIYVGTSPGDNPPQANSLGQLENVSGTLLIANNDIDMQGTGGNSLGIVIFAVGKSPDKEVDIYVSGNNIRNTTEPAINFRIIGGRVHAERNVISTGAVAGGTPDAIRVVGAGSYLIAHNSIDCGWGGGAASGINVYGQGLNLPQASAVVVDNDVTMSAPNGTVFGDNSAGIEIKGFAQGNAVVNNRIRGRARAALAVAGLNGGIPRSTLFVSNDLEGFQSSLAGVFIDTGAINTVLLGRQIQVEDHGTNTVVVPMQ